MEADEAGRGSAAHVRLYVISCSSSLYVHTHASSSLNYQDMNVIPEFRNRVRIWCTSIVIQIRLCVTIRIIFG